MNSEAAAVIYVLRPSLMWQLWIENCKGESVMGLGDRLDLRNKGIEEFQVYMLLLCFTGILVE